MQQKHYAVAIDGPSGAGKSTIARSVAQDLGFLYVDTGAIYRTVGYSAYRKDLDPSDRDAVVDLLPRLRLEMGYGEDGLQHMVLDGEDVTTKIRLPQISLYASRISALPEVRAFLMDMQRSAARDGDVIMDGRDIGTVVLPDADVKIFLTATPEDRANRRYQELLHRGTPKEYGELLEEIRQRDYNDTHRAAAPLRPAQDAVRLDTTGNTFDQSCREILQIIKERIRL
jgi:cytidylate kinase